MGSIIIWPQIRIDYNGVGVLRGQPLIPSGEKSWKGRKHHSTFIPDPAQLSLEETGSESSQTSKIKTTVLQFINWKLPDLTQFLVFCSQIYDRLNQCDVSIGQ